MIEVKGLYKSFDDKTVLSDINATFETVSYTHLDVYKRQPTSGRSSLCCDGVPFA